jgi:hypothetical protein
LKEKINWRTDMIFCMLSTQSQEEREGEKRKVISGQTSSNHNTRVI